MQLSSMFCRDLTEFFVRLCLFSKYEKRGRRIYLVKKGNGISQLSPPRKWEYNFGDMDPPQANTFLLERLRVLYALHGYTLIG
jgi:hypothetical protein